MVSHRDAGAFYYGDVEEFKLKKSMVKAGN
jgi:hypothetical protein